jgi:putative SOS response-associated peptidase YedK
MPVILAAEAMLRWIGDAPLDEGEYRSLVRPFEPGLMESRPVSRFVSSSRNQGPRCLDPPEEVPPEPELDFG